MTGPIDRLIKPRLRVSDDRAAALEKSNDELPKPMACVYDLLVDRLTLLDACDEMYGVIEQLRIERQDAYEIASEKHQQTVAKLRGELAAAKARLAENERPSREEIMSACHSLIARAGGVRKAATACGEHPSNFVSIVKGRRRISRPKLRRIESALAATERRTEAVAQTETH